MNSSIAKNIRHNYLMNTLDGSFFGFAMGFASFTTVIPLFLSGFTGSAILIGLIPAIRAVGYQLPPLFLAKAVARRKRYMPMILLNTLHERIPFLGLAIIAFFSPRLGDQASLILAFLCIVWQGLGGGLTANPLQNLIARVFPSDIRATVIGTQSSANNLMASGSAVLAGLLLAALPAPINYVACFLCAFLGVAISYICLANLRETVDTEEYIQPVDVPLWQSIRAILTKDISFRSFLAARMLAQFAMMASAFYMIYAVRAYHISSAQAGAMTGVLFLTQVIANPVIGLISRRWGRKNMLEVGALGMALAPALAAWSPAAGWFYGVFILTGIANAIFNTLGLAFILEFGGDAERPTYFGLANTLIAPISVLAPLFGGAVADSAGFQSTFLWAAGAGLLTALVLRLFVTDPHRIIPFAETEEQLSNI
jgi:MFS family permease